MGFVGTEAKRVAVDVTSAGDNELVAAVSGKKIRVLSLFLSAGGGNNTLRLESGAAGSALTGQILLANKEHFQLSFNPEGWMETVAGESLNLELLSGTAVAGVLVYVEV